MGNGHLVGASDDSVAESSLLFRPLSVCQPVSASADMQRWKVVQGLRVVQITFLCDNVEESVAGWSLSVGVRSVNQEHRGERTPRE